MSDYGYIKRQLELDDPRGDHVFADEGADPADEVFKLADISRP